MKKVFISHASKDVAIVKSLIDDLLVGALAVKLSEIFCTTTDGTRIESGDDWRDSIAEALQNAKITFLIITPNYKESEVCMCEMGAAWVTSSKVIPLIVDPINYSTVGIIQQPKQVEKLLDDKSLDRVRDIIQETLEIPSKEIKSDRWSTKKIEFLEKINNHLTENPFLPPLSRDEFINAIKKINDLQKAVKSIVTEKADLQSLIDDLMRAKDAKEVKIIEKKHKKVDSMDEFNALCKNVNKKLSKLSSIVRGIAFISYTRKDVSVQYNGNEVQIDEAISKDYVSSGMEGELEADWDTTSLMSDLHNSLDELRAFINEKSEEKDFFDSYTVSFKAPLSLSNKDFWEEAFDLQIAIA